MTIKVQLPDGRTVTVQTSDPQVAQQAARRMLARESMVAGKSAASPVDLTAANFANTASLGTLAPLAGGISAATTAVKNAVTRAQGGTPQFGADDAYAARRGIISDMLARNANAHPGLSGISGLLGAFATPGLGEAVGALKGVSLAAKAPLAVRGLLTGLETGAKGAAVGAGVGGVSGASNAAPGQELTDAAQGAQMGGLLGGVVAPAAGAAMAPVARGAGTIVSRLANRATGGQLAPPAAVATQLLTRSLQADGATPDVMKTALNTWLSTGGDTPSLLDLATKLPGGGGNTVRLLTGAAMRGGTGAAQKYARATAGALPDRVKALAANLTTDPSSATDLATSLEGRQSSQADQLYPGPYSTQIEATPKITGALADQSGANAITQAINEASARQDYPRVERLKALMAPAEEAPTARIGDVNVPLPQHILDQIQTQMPQAAADAGLTAGDLDRVRIALGKQGATQQAREGGVASGLFARAGQLDDALADVPELGEARSNYAATQAQRDALETGGSALSAIPDDYAKSMKEFLSKATAPDNPYPVSAEDIQSAAQVGHRQAITDAVGQVPAGFTAPLNRFANAPNITANQDTDFGASAQPFRDAINNEIQRMTNARRLDPNVNSMTASREDALAEPSLKAPKLTLGSAAMGLVNKIMDGATLTDAERDAVVKMGTSLSDPAFTHLDPQDKPVLDFLTQYVAQPAPAVGANLLGSAAQPQP